MRSFRIIALLFICSLIGFLAVSKASPVHADGEHHHDSTDFLAWTETDSLPASGNYYLTDDVTITSTWKPAGGMHVCLNGHGIKMAGVGNVIQVTGGTSLYIFDCRYKTDVIEHKYQINEETGLAVVDDTLESDYETFKGGYITGGNGVSTGGAIYLPGGPKAGNTTSVYFIGGTIIGNSTTGNGGAILYNYQSRRNSNILLRDVNIIGNVADGNGGAIFHGANNKSLTITGDSIITKNVAGSSPAGVFEASTLNISGNSYIYGNRLKDGTPSDIVSRHENQDHVNISSEFNASGNALIGFDYIDTKNVTNFYTNCSDDPNDVMVNHNNQIFGKSGNDAVYNTVTAPNYEVTYDAEDHGASVSLLDSETPHEILYGTSEGTYDLSTSPLYQEPGEYVVYYKITAGLNEHVGSQKITISKIALALPLAKENLKQNGEEQELLDISALTIGTYEYKLGEDGEWSSLVPKASSTQTYDVYVRATGDDHHSDIEETLIQVSILENDKTELSTEVETAETYYEEINDDYINTSEALRDLLDDASELISDLDATEEEINEMVTSVEKLVNEIKDEITNINNVVGLINDIGEVAYNKDSKDKIDAASSAYNVLKENNQKDVSNYELLTLAESTYAKLKDDNEKAQVVIDLIDQIGEIKYDATTKELLDSISDAYAKLTDDQKALVNNKSSLDDAVNAYQTLSDNAVNDVKTKINNIGEVTYTTESKTKIDDAKASYNALLDSDKEKVDNYQTLTLAIERYNVLKADYEKAQEVVELINQIGEIKYNAATKELLDSISDAYAKLTDDQKAFVNNKSSLDDAVNAYQTLSDNAVNDAKTKINNIGEVAYTTESKTKIDDAKAAYEALLDSDKEKVDNYQTLTLAESTYAKLKDDNAKAQIVIDLINQIGEIKYDDATKELLASVSAAYDALTDDQKAFVNNKSSLDDAVNGYQTMSDNAVNNTKTKINNIGEVAYTPESRIKIEDANYNYNSLLDSDKEKVDNYQTLTLAIERYNALKADYEKAQEVIDLIDSMDQENVELVEATRNAYNTLTPEQKALVNNYLVLQNAEDNIAKSHKTFVILMICLGVVGGLVLILGLTYLALFFIFNKWIIDNNKPRRVFKIKSVEDNQKLLMMNFKAIYKDKEEVFDTKPETENK